jgi:hypothetical protein
MRWAIPKIDKPQIGDKRTLIKYLFFPKCLDGRWRWLEFAMIEQEYTRWISIAPECRPIPVVGWRDLRWSN